jgi:hypothetical protein
VACPVHRRAGLSLVSPDFRVGEQTWRPGTLPLQAVPGAFRKTNAWKVWGDRPRTGPLGGRGYCLAKSRADRGSNLASATALGEANTRSREQRSSASPLFLASPSKRGWRAGILKSRLGLRSAHSQEEEEEEEEERRGEAESRSLSCGWWVEDVSGLP